MIVSSETGVMYGWADTEGQYPMECMKVKFGTNNEKWETLGFGAVENFKYVRGYEYSLVVQRTTLANPPADGSCYTYRLIKIQNSKCVVIYPNESGITSESELEYEIDSPAKFYDIWNNEITVDNEGTLGHNQQDGTTNWLSFDKAEVYLQYVLHNTDARWSKNKYMPTKAYVISPFSSTLRRVEINHNSMMFKSVVTDEEYQKIKSSINAGESVSYSLILVNAWQKAIQKLEFKIKKI